MNNRLSHTHASEINSQVKKTHRAQNCRAFSQPVKCTTPSGSKKGQDDIKKQRLVVYFRKPMTFCTDWGARNTSQH